MSHSAGAEAAARRITERKVANDRSNLTRSLMVDRQIRRLKNVPRDATGVATAVLLAYMPFAGRVDATSDAVSQSRILEVLFLAMATAGGAALRGQRTRGPAPPAVFFLMALVSGFSFWAMVTSFNGPYLLTGLVKALELLAITFVAFEIASAMRLSEQGGRARIADTMLLSIVAVVGVLILSNVVLLGTPLPMSEVEDWPAIGGRSRLILGANHPLTSALLLAFGVIACINATSPWSLRLPVLIGMEWLLHLCDARGIGAGCSVGVLLFLFRQIPRSPYKLLASTFAICAVIFVAATILLSGQLDKLIVQFAGSDAFTLNSRVGLWSFILARVPENPILGVGYYSTRFYILDAFPFAGHAHNSAVEVLFSTGLIGLACFVLFLGVWIYALIVSADPLLIGISPVILFEGSLDPILFTPGVGMFLMLLVLLNALFVAHRRTPGSRRLAQVANRLSRPTAVQ